MLKRWVQDVRLYLAGVFAQGSQQGTSVAHGGSKVDSQGQEDHKTEPFDGTYNQESATPPRTSGTQTDATCTSAFSTEPDVHTATQTDATQLCVFAQGTVQDAHVAHGESNTPTQTHTTRTRHLGAERDVHTGSDAQAGVQGTAPQHSAQPRGASAAPASAQGDGKRHCPRMPSQAEAQGA